MKNNIHIVGNSFSHGSRILKETASLVKSDIVDRITIFALYQKGLNEYEKLDGRRYVRRVKLRSRSWPKIFVVQMIKYIEFCYRAICYAIKNDIKVITIHHLFLLPLGVFLKFILRGQLIYDAHELETETFGLGGFRQKILKILEHTLIKYADLTLVVSDGIEKWYRAKYHLLNIVSVLNCPERRGYKKTQRLREELNIPLGKKIILYQGGLIPGRGVEQLLKIFYSNDDGTHVLVCMGYGELENVVKEYSHNCNNIFFKEAVHPDVVLEYTASADFGISYIDNPSLNDFYCLPNKMFEYIMAGLPVFVNNAPEMKKVVEGYRLGMVLNELTFLALQNGIYEFSKEKPEDIKSNFAKASDDFSWEKQAEIMINALKKYVF